MESSSFLRIPHSISSHWHSRKVWLTWTVLLSIVLAPASGNTAPRFDMSSVFYLPEDTPVGTLVFQLVATDNDGDKLFYSINGDGANYFSVDRETGNVILKQTVDYERTKTIIVDAAVTDNINVEVSKRLTVIVEDRNDNRPIFKNEPYITDVLENTVIGSAIYKVLAEDEDSGIAGRVSYAIEEVIPNNVENHNLFYIQYDGTVVLNGSLSYNNKSTFYRIKIIATDGGGLLHGVTVYHNNTAYLSVTVVDVADLDPEFLREPYVGSVPENCPLGTSVLTVEAIDRDKDVNDVIYYNIPTVTSLFTIDRITGVISVNGHLDREGVPGEQVELQVVAREANLNIYQQVAQVNTSVTIQVTDVNDNTPKFYLCKNTDCNFTNPPESNFSGQIEEHASPRTPIANLDIVAYDPDQGNFGTFQLSLLGPDAFAFSVSPQKIVNVGTVQVLVSNSSAVDYEKIPDHSMTVKIVANDTGKTTDCCSFASVTIHLLDINDNRPEFKQSEYKLSVLEESPPGTIITSNITATDPDSGKFGEITYQLLPTSILSTFTVNAASGEVLVAQGAKLDWGTRSVYYATLQAVDGGGLSGSTQLEITVVDINNNPPIVSGSYNVFVTEGDSNLSVQIQATDKDDPTTNNSLLYFEIVPGDFSSNFTIDPYTGVLKSTGPLDREAIPVALDGKVVVTVLVLDMGIPQLSTTVNVTFIVEDRNDNAPRFNSSFYDFYVQEDKRGVCVGNVEATDADQTEINNRISFSIENNNNFLMRSQYLGPGWYLGNLCLAPDVALDYDTPSQRIFNLSVQAENSDFGGKVDTAFATVEVHVLDINDESPVIVPSPPNDISVLENVTLNELVATLQASDVDSNHSLVFQELATACFNHSVNVGNFCQNWFRLEPNGSLFVNTPEIDFEACNLVELTLRVEDVFTEKGDPYSRNEILRILIVDVNDNPPVFLPITNTFVVIPEVALVDLQVATVRATDADSGVNSVITFAISSVVLIQDNGLNQIFENIFKVVTTAEKNLYTGSIQVASMLTPSLKGRYQVTVEAKDHGLPPLSSLTSLDIFTVDQSYRVGLQFGRPVQDVQANSDQIKVALSMATGATVYVAAIKSSEESSTPRSARASENTVMEAYFVYSNGTALTAEHLGRLIQSHPEALAHLLNLGLKTIVPGQVTDDSEEKKLFGIIIGLAVAVLLILLIMILALVGVRKSHKRKLKALHALKLASVLPANAAQQGPAIPGTNKYNAEGANPVLGFSLDPAMDLGFEDHTHDEVASLNSLDENTVDAPESGSARPPQKMGNRSKAHGWEEPLKAALENHNLAGDKPQQPAQSKKCLTFDNPCLDTTDL